MIQSDIIIDVPVEDLKRRFEYMLQMHDFNFQFSFGNPSLQTVLNFPFDKLPIYNRLKEMIRMVTVHKLVTVRDYLKFVTFNHTPPLNFKTNDFQLIVYFNTQLISFLKASFRDDFLEFEKQTKARLDGATWFEKDIPFWVNPTYIQSK